MREADVEAHGVPALVAQDGYVLPDADKVVVGGSPMRPLQRLQLLCDDGSLHLLRSEVTSAAMGDRARAGDGVIGAGGQVGRRPIACYAQDAGYAGGSLGAAHADTIVRVQRMARQASVPVVGFVESGGARMQEGLAALDGYARVFAEHVAASGRIPQISVISGTSAGGGAYAPALTDFVVMTQSASMFLTGPAVVREVTGQQTTARDLGGPEVHGRNGVCHFVVESDVDAIFLVRQLLGYLPSDTSSPPPRAPARDPDGPDPGGTVP